MKKIIFCFALAITILSCKKENADPKTTTVTVHDTVKTTSTVTVIQHDTAYCTPKSDIIQGTWYCYYNGSTISPSQVVNFYSNHFVWDGASSGNTISYSSNYSTVYGSGMSTVYTVKVYNCNELLLLDALQTPYRLRRNP